MLCWLGCSYITQAQYFHFTTQPDSFAVDVVRGLHTIKLEATNKVAFDFKSAWTGQITNNQKSKLIEICVKMRDRRMHMSPYYRYLFSLFTYAITQENANEQDLDNLLDVLDHSVTHYSKEEYLNLCRTLTYFFARGYLYYSPYNKLTTAGGSYSLKLLEELEPLTPQFPALLEQAETDTEESEFITQDDEMFQMNDFGAGNSDEQGWGNDDGWSNQGGDVWGAVDETDFGFLADPDKKKPEQFVRQTFELEKLDLVAQYQANDILPLVGGAVIELENMEFKVATPFDTIRIKNVEGTLILKSGVFVGKTGVVDWPDDIRGTDGVLVNLNQFSFNIKNPTFSSSRAQMVYPQLFQDSLAGAFVFHSPIRKKRTEKYYPKFTSLYSKKELDFGNEQIEYVGGFGLWGNKKVGTSISKEPSVLKVKSDNERSFKTRSGMYYFEDSIINSDLAELFLYHDRDSIYHPAIRINYDAGKSQLNVYKDKGGFKHTYYYSSFFKMEFKADMIEWDMNSDSLDISIMNGSTMIPAVFESEDYFNPIRFAKLSGLFGFHPVTMVVNYARKINQWDYNIMELVTTYKIPKESVFSAVIFLQQNGYVTYDKETGNIHVLRKAFHYVMSNFKQKDFDNFLVSSVSPNEPNASLNFATKEMNVRGVKRVYITPDQEVYLEPDSMVLTLIEDKGMKFNGMVNAEGFQYKGKEFVFDYNQYLIDMRVIDSIRIQVKKKEDKEREPLHQHLETTSGTLYINNPKNKAGLKKFVQYPYFVSDSEAIVYFDGKDILGGNYDRSVYFIVPPFKSDTVGQEDIDALGFEGTFYSGGILPPIKQTLKIMPDRALGFHHTIPPSGYNLYEGEGVLYDSMRVDAGGIQGMGRMTYRTAEVNSEHYVFYMDSVKAEGQKGLIKEGIMDGASYPEAQLIDFRMLWLPMKDSMYIENRKEPFKFYNSTASLDGKANITAKGVYGSGEMISRGSRSVSNEFHFEKDQYSGRHAEFEILTDNPEKPAMAGADIKLEFDLTKNEASVQPEVAGVAAISFPYSQMKTSISKATWYLDSNRVYMKKPQEVDIKYSYFYTTRPDLDSLSFNATGAFYDMDAFELNIYGIPYIEVADAKLIPNSHETTILENSVLLPFKNVDLEMDTLNGYHKLHEGNITIISRKKFEGDAVYRLTNSAGDEYDIKMRDFAVRIVENASGRLDSMTTAHGYIGEEMNVEASPGFYYKGEVELRAANEKLAKDGFITPDFKSMGRSDYWIEYAVLNDTANVLLKIDNAKTETGQNVTAGLLIDQYTGELYMSYLQSKRNEEDKYFFKAQGQLSFSEKNGEFIIEDSLKHFHHHYDGKSFIYNDRNGKLTFEGPVGFVKNTDRFKINSSIVGYAVPETNTYLLNAMMLFDFKVNPKLMDMMYKDIEGELDKVGAKTANRNDADLIRNIAQLTNNELAKGYEKRLLKDYSPLYKLSHNLEKTIALTNVELKWSKDHKAWYSTAKIGLSHIFDNDINALLDGFMEIKKGDDGEDVVNLLLQVSAGAWYYLSFDQGRLLIFSSNGDFNQMIVDNSKASKVGFGEYTLVLGDEFEVLGFVDEFRLKYWGISSQYNLEFPDDIQLEDTSEIKTIEEGNEQNNQEDKEDNAQEEEDQTEKSEEPTPKTTEDKKVEDDGF